MKVRPGVAAFLHRLSKLYELTVFTAGLQYYADAVLDKLDTSGLITSRVYRQHCTKSGEYFVKDLEMLGRDLTESIIIDDSQQSFAFHPKNAIFVESWFGDTQDRVLYDLITVLQELYYYNDVREILDGNSRSVAWLMQNMSKSRSVPVIG